MMTLEDIFSLFFIMYHLLICIAFSLFYIILFAFSIKVSMYLPVCTFVYKLLSFIFFAGVCLVFVCVYFE